MIHGDDGGDGGLAIETVCPSFLTKESLHQLMYAGKAVRIVGTLVPMEVRKVYGLSGRFACNVGNLSVTYWDLVLATTCFWIFVQCHVQNHWCGSR